MRRIAVTITASVASSRVHRRSGALLVVAIGQQRVRNPPNRAACLQGRAAFSRPRHHLRPRAREPDRAAVRERHPAGQIERAAVGAHGGDIIRRPVEAAREIGERHLGGDRRGRAGKDRKRGGGAQPGRRAGEDEPLGSAPASGRLDSVGGLQHHAAVRRRQHARGHVLGAAGAAVGPHERNRRSERRLDQPGGGEQVRVAVLLDDPAGQPRDDRGAGQDPVGDTLEPQSRLPRRKRDAARLGDECESTELVEVEAARAPGGIAVNRDGERVGGRRGHIRRRRVRGDGRRQQEAQC